MSLTLTARTLVARAASCSPSGRRHGRPSTATVPHVATPSTGAVQSELTAESGGGPTSRATPPPVTVPTDGRAEAAPAPSTPATPATGCTDCETGMATAEYAIATVAAAGFAGLLVAILRSGEVRELLLGIIRSALSV